MNVADEAGKTSTALIEALKGQPLCLVLLLVCLALVGYIFYKEHGQQSFRSELLAKCGPQHTGGHP